MSTEILFNSPALHSLKRAQLIRLCRKYGIKAVGKNTELVAKLKQHATNMPAATFSLSSDTGDVDTEATEEEEDESQADVLGTRPSFTRASQQWEIIEEEVENANGTFTQSMSQGSLAGSKREFGENLTNALVKSASITSSLKAFASSLKRSTSTKIDEVTDPRDLRPAAPQPQQHTIPHNPALPVMSTPAEASAPPETSVPTTETPTEPAGPSTIRLVSSPKPQERRLSPEYRQIPMLSSFFPTLAEGLASPSRSSPSLYPTLPQDAPHMDEDEKEAPGAFPKSDQTTPKRVAPPFLFGSPKNAVSKDEFSTAAQSVLDELNRRVVAIGGKPLDTAGPRISFTSAADYMTTDTTTRFDRAHDKHFSKMDSITNHYAANRASPSKSGPSDFHSRAQKRKSMDSPTDDKPFTSAAPEEEVENPRETKRPRTSLYAQTRKIQIAETAEKDAQEVVQVKESAATKRKMEQARARRSSAPRRSSVGRRVSSGVRVASNASGKSTATGRTFGFFKSSAKLMKSVFTGASKPVSATTTAAVKPAPATTTAPRPPVKPIPTSTSASRIPTVATTPSTTLKSPSALPVPISKPFQLTATAATTKTSVSTATQPKPALPLPKSSAYMQLSAVANTRSGSGARPSAAATKPPSVAPSRASSRASTHRAPSVPQRKPLPSFDGNANRQSSAPRQSSIAGSRLPSSRSMNRQSMTPAQSSIAGSRVASSSSFTRQALVPPQSSIAQSRYPSSSSLFKDTTRIPSGASATKDSTITKTPVSSSVASKRPSTLHAPTAASLARMQATVRPPQAVLLPVQEQTGLLSTLTSSNSANATFTPIFNPPSLSPGAAVVKSQTSIALASPAKRALQTSTPKPATKTARRKPRISRGRVIAQLNERRNVAAGLTPGPYKPRSSLAAKAHSRRSLGGVKAAAGISRPSAAVEMQRLMKARKSEAARRKTQARASAGLKSAAASE